VDDAFVLLLALDPPAPPDAGAPSMTALPLLSKRIGDLVTCNKDQKCKDSLACAQKCNQEQKCLGECAAKNDSSATQALVACRQKNCTTACANTSGAGGAGSAGSGGAMGSGGMAGMGGSSI
jgi:hypothetical protein